MASSGGLVRTFTPKDELKADISGLSVQTHVSSTEDLIDEFMEYEIRGFPHRETKFLFGIPLLPPRANITETVFIYNNGGRPSWNFAGWMWPRKRPN
jgi:hypothetical protein